jgi:diguanylate cyclase (GGDEF)-like protein
MISEPGRQDYGADSRRHAGQTRSGSARSGQRVVTGILTPHANRRPLIIAGATALCITGCTAAALPWAGRPLLNIPSFVAMCAVMLALIQGLTAYFLAVQWRFTREPFLAALASGYGYVAVIIICQLLVFPDILGSRGLLDAGPQASIWMWVEWQAGFPFIVFTGLLWRQYVPLRVWLAETPLAGWMILASGPAAALVIAGWTMKFSDQLPELVNGMSYVALQHSWTSALVLVLTGAALAACVRVTRLRDLLSLWLAVALLAALGNAVLTLAGPERYSAGWYGGRTLNLLSASFVFCVLIFEYSMLYERLLVVNARLSDLAFYDALTGAFNRGYFNEQFSREVRRATRERNALSILMIDVDHFKSYNDVHGHQNGDLCLRNIVGAVRDCIFRPGDFVARYGGEEFIVVLPQTSGDNANLLAIKIREKIAARDLRRIDTPERPVTVSLGIATFDPAAEILGPDELIRRADHALYQAKKHGRDQVQIYSGAAVSPELVRSGQQSFSHGV